MQLKTAAVAPGPDAASRDWAPPGPGAEQRRRYEPQQHGRRREQQQRQQQRQQHQQRQRHQQRGPARLWFVDWLRVFLTLCVVAHHCFSSMRPVGGDQFMWFVQKGTQEDYVINTFIDLVVTAPSMAYAMCLFFLLAGYFTPGSCARKGPWGHLLDRCVRLVVPVVVYAVLIFPLILCVNKAAGIPAGSPAPLAFLRDVSYAQLWAGWFSVFSICPGPTWFIWCLFWFDVAYVLLHVLGSCARRLAARLWGRRAAAVTATAAAAAADNGAAGSKAAADAGACRADKDGSGAAAAQAGGQEAGHVVVDTSGGHAGTPAATATTQAPCHDSAAGRRGGSRAGRRRLPTAEYSVRTVVLGMAGLSLIFTAVGFGALMATYNASNLVGGYDGFVNTAYVISFRPSWLGPNIISFFLGCEAAKRNSLRRLPARVGPWCLCAAAAWWPLGCLMPTWINNPTRPSDAWGVSPMPLLLVVYVAYEQLARWSFAVVWAVGLLLLFREAFDAAPAGWVGRQAVACAYGAYVLHPLLIALWAWALLPVPFLTFAAPAICLVPLVTVSSWAATALLRLVPGARRVLG